MGIPSENNLITRRRSRYLSGCSPSPSKAVSAGVFRCLINRFIPPTLNFGLLPVSRVPDVR